MEAVNDVASSGFAEDAKPAATTKSKSWFRKLKTYAAYGSAILVIVIFLGNVFWTMSGNNEWSLELDKEGVQVYSLKAPGSYIKQYRAVMKTDFTLTQLVAGLIENSTQEMCRNSIPGCSDVQVIEPWSTKTMSDTVLWKLDLPSPFSPRETLIRSGVAQDPVTKVVTVDVFAVPNVIPRNKGVVRLTHMQNRWTYTPLPEGGVEIEFLQDIDMGGMFPDFLLNLAGAEEAFKFIHDQLPLLIDRDELRAVQYDFIEEL